MGPGNREPRSVAYPLPSRQICRQKVIIAGTLTDRPDDRTVFTVHSLRFYQSSSADDAASNQRCLSETKQS